MYIRQLDTFYVEIPKTGTGSIVSSLSDLYYPVAVRGHRQVSDCVNLLGRVPSRVTCCIRHPLDRFVSAFNFFCSDFVELDYWLNVLYVRDVVRSDGFAFFECWSHHSGNQLMITKYSTGIATF